MEVYKKGELAKKILFAAAAGGAFATILVLPGMSVLFAQFGARNTKERYRIKRSIMAMERQGYLLREVKKGKERLIISKKGKEKLDKILLTDVQIPIPKKWDKKWRLVMFDIPDTKSKIRQEVSWRIKDLGMEAIQNSVFVSPYPCKKEVNHITHHYGVQQYFVYVEADTIESNKDLINYFKLNT